MTGRRIVGAVGALLLLAIVAPAGSRAEGNEDARLRRITERVRTQADSSPTTHAATTFTDPAGDSGQAIDIQTVDVTVTTDDIINWQLVSPYGSLELLDVILVFIDSDSNAATGAQHWGGTEYGLLLDGDGTSSSPSFDLLRWTGNAWEITTPSHLLNYELLTDRIVLRSSAQNVGNPTGFNFYVATLYPDDPAVPDPDVDQGPDDFEALWAYGPSSETGPKLRTFRADCDKPCERGRVIDLFYELRDPAPATEDVVHIFSSAKKEPVRTWTTELKENPAGTRWFFEWPAPKRPVGWHKFCARATDDSGNTSKRSCSKIVFPRIDTDAEVLRRRLSWGIIMDHLKLKSIPKGSVVDIDCVRSCGIHERDKASRKFTSKKFRGVSLPNGAVIAVRVSHDRWVGYYEKLTVKGATGLKSVVRCMAPGQRKPVKRCR